METLRPLFFGTGVATAVFWISATAFTGVLLGKCRLCGVGLGVAGVLFSGLLFAHFGVQADPQLLHFAREFGLVLFVYAIGIDVGPRFLTAFRSDGLRLNLLAAVVVLLGFALAWAFHAWAGVDTAVITGVMSGAVTNTPGLGAAQQLLAEHGGARQVGIAGTGYALAYPFGVVGVIVTMLLIRLLFGIRIEREVADYHVSVDTGRQKIESVMITVANPNLIGQRIGHIRSIIDEELIISRICRGEHQLIPRDDIVLLDGDVLHGVSATDRLDALRLKIGPTEISMKREIPGDLAMFHTLITHRGMAGRSIEQIGIGRRYEANITRIFRSGTEILPTATTVVELGDVVRIVGKRELLDDIRQEFGNSVKELVHPNPVPIFLGIFLGVLLGSIPLTIPGLPVPARLGMAGGPLLVAMFLGYKGRIGTYDFYIAPGASAMLRELGIILFLACVGLSAGEHFAETFRAGGHVWMLYGSAITFVPLFVVAIAARLMNTTYLKLCGVLAGAMTDPPALEFANGLAQTQAQSTAYATVYPLTMFLRIVFAQVLVLTGL
ncbi:MAG: putative transporter [Candidatus Accumulibacter sp.]|nr:putative transporter [Accumulibacter sp.]